MLGRILGAFGIQGWVRIRPFTESFDGLLEQPQWTLRLRGNERQIAVDRFDEHLYEFQFGKRPFDPKGPNYGIPDPHEKKKGHGDARTTALDALDLKPERAFGYLFDFGDEWFHQIQVERIEQAIPTVTYPRVVKRVGPSPPQYAEE